MAKQQSLFRKKPIKAAKKPAKRPKAKPGKVSVRGYTRSKPRR